MCQRHKHKHFTLEISHRDTCWRNRILKNRLTLFSWLQVQSRGGSMPRNVNGSLPTMISPIRNSLNVDRKEATCLKRKRTKVRSATLPRHHPAVFTALLFFRLLAGTCVLAQEVIFGCESYNRKNKSNCRFQDLEPCRQKNYENIKGLVYKVADNRQD